MVLQDFLEILDFFFFSGLSLAGPREAGDDRLASWQAGQRGSLAGGTQSPRTHQGGLGILGATWLVGPS